MAQRKILLDTCVYLRLGKHIRPLLRQVFGDDDYCLYVIPEIEDEYFSQSRLQSLHPWVMESAYTLNRDGEILLSKKQMKLRDQTALVFDAEARKQDIDLSRVDLMAIATSCIADIPLATDDDGLQDLGLSLDVETIGSLELLHLMLQHGFITRTTVADVLVYLETLPDLPKRYWYDKKRLFAEFEDG